MTTPTPQELLALADRVHNETFAECTLAETVEDVLRALAAAPSAGAGAQETDPRLIMRQQRATKRIADIYGVWEREKDELHILRALQEASPPPPPPYTLDREVLVKLLREAEKALAHLEVCGGCGEDSWNECPGGRQAAETLSAISLALLRAPTPTGEG